MKIADAHWLLSFQKSGNDYTGGYSLFIF